MGCKPEPSYANMFKARKIDIQIGNLALKYQENSQISLKYLKRFLGDNFLVFLGRTANHYSSVQDINLIHPNKKCTMYQTTPSLNHQELPFFPCPPVSSIPYLDVSCEIKEGIVTDLYGKATAKNKYLLTSS